MPDEDADPRILRSRAKLLAAATALLMESGPQAVTVDAVAERSGVAKSTMYRHWPSRDDLLLAVMRAHHPIISTPDLGGGFETALRALLAEVADTFAEPEWASILPALIALQHHRPELTELLAEDRRAQLSVLAAVLEAGRTEGYVPLGIDLQTSADLLFGPLLLATLRGERGRLHELAGHSVDRFIAGLGASS
ncbi:MAG: TetR/AcrR family transcriptional regulator [Acidimicrobiales bacterium]